MTQMIVKETDDGELYIELPDELMEKMGWDEDTELVWTVWRYPGNSHQSSC
jgi:hypothetical protein